MTPQEALNGLDKAVSTLEANRVTHIKLQQAVKVLQDFIDQKKKKKPTVDKTPAEKNNE